jgi:hypothetical protein
MASSCRWRSRCARDARPARNPRSSRLCR